MIEQGRSAAIAIRNARKRAGLTQEQAAALRGHATSTISRWETGGLPQTWEELARYANALGESIVIQFGPKKKSAPAEAEAPKWAVNLTDKIVRTIQNDRLANRATEANEIAAAVAASLAPLLSRPRG